jgi:hypothetical protein
MARSGAGAPWSMKMGTTRSPCPAHIASRLPENWRTEWRPEHDAEKCEAAFLVTNAKRCTQNIMLQIVRIDHDYDFGSIRSKIIVIWDYATPRQGVFQSTGIPTTSFSN